MRRPAKLSAEALRKAKPIRNPDVTELECEGVLSLRGPAVLRGMLGKWFAKSSPEPVFKTYELEEIGSFVWSQIDGKRSFDSLAKSLQTRYKMNRLESEASLEAFLR